MLGQADSPLAVWQHVVGSWCQEPPWGTAIPLKTGWDSPGVAVFSSGVSCAAVVVQCLDEKAVLCFCLYRELLMGQPRPWAQLLAELLALQAEIHILKHRDRVK